MKKKRFTKFMKNIEDIISRKRENGQRKSKLCYNSTQTTNFKYKCTPLKRQNTAKLDNVNKREKKLTFRTTMHQISIDRAKDSSNSTAINFRNRK